MLAAIDISTEPSVREGGPRSAPATAEPGMNSRTVLIASAAAKLAEAARRIEELEAKIEAFSVRSRGAWA